MGLESMPKSFDLACKNGTIPIYLTRPKFLDYVGPYPEPKYYGADFKSGDERAQFLAWYEEQKEFSIIRKSCWLSAWMTSMYWDRHSALFEICF
jgi:hypothetical protein